MLLGRPQWRSGETAASGGRCSRFGRSAVVPLSPLPSRMDTNRRWPKHLGAGLSRWSLRSEAQIGWCSPRPGMATFPRTPVTRGIRLPVESKQVGAATGHAGNTIVNRCEPFDRSSRRSLRQYSERSGPKICKRSTIRRWSMRQWFVLMTLALCGIDEVSIYGGWYQDKEPPVGHLPTTRL